MDYYTAFENSKRFVDNFAGALPFAAFRNALVASDLRARNKTAL